MCPAPLLRVSLRQEDILILSVNLIIEIPTEAEHGFSTFCIRVATVELFLCLVLIEYRF